MKKMRLFAAAFAAAAMLASCSEDGPSIETAIVTFEGSAWTPFVASSFDATYSGEVATADYVWEDSATSLTGPNIFSGGYFSGGWVVSSYNSNDLAAYGDYATDLYVYNPTNENATTRGGHNNSDTFLIGYGNKSDWGDFRPSLKFADGKARVVCGCYVNSTCYFLNIAKNGNYSSPAIGEGEKVEIHATGYDAEGNETGTVTMLFAEKDRMITTWTAWDLSSLGEVVEVKFDMTGDVENEYGFAMPTYYAIDDVTVEWPAE
ncbi:MAG: DUF4465 domain-containing protein [Alistipes sp.]|nr:DUF4465 domain-containing protein [Alistipes sp.]